MKFSAEEVLAEINKQAPTFGVDPKQAIALFMAENSGSGNAKTADGAAVSKNSRGEHVGALGIMQVMPSTARGLQKAGFLPPDWTHDPANMSSQVQAGMAAIKEMRGRMKNLNDVFELATMYNAGNEPHKQYLAGNIAALPSETKDYFRKVKVAYDNQGVQSTMPSIDRMTFTPSGSGATVSGQPARTGQTSGTTTRRSVSDPAAMDMFTNSIMDTAGPGGTIDQATDAIIAGGQLRTDAQAAQKMAIMQKATADADKAASLAMIQGTAAMRLNNTLAALDLHPDVTNNLRMRTANIINQTDEQLSQLKPEIDEKMAVGFFDNPIQWMMNQTTLPGMVAKYNAVASNQNKAIDKYKQLEALKNDGKQDAVATMDADLISRGLVATQQSTAAEAAAKASELQVANAAAAARDAMSLAQLSGNKAQFLSAQVNATKETVTQREGQTAKEAAAEADARQLEAYNKTMIAAGKAPYESMKAINGLSKEERDQLNNATSKGKFGDDFATSFDFVNIDGIAKTADTEARRWYNGTMSKAGENVKAKSVMAAKAGKKFDGIAETKAELNVLQNLYQAEAETDMRTASANNPMKLNYVTIAKMPELQNNLVAQWLNFYGPKGKEPRFAIVDENRMMHEFAYGVANGKMTAEQVATSITEFYKIATKEQIARTKWNLFGLNQPARTYAVKLTLAGDSMFGGDVTMDADLGNYSQVENYVTRATAKYARENFATHNGQLAGQQSGNFPLGALQ